MLKRCLFITFLLLVFSFPVDGFAIDCTRLTSLSAERIASYIAQDPNDPIRHYMAGSSIYCEGNVEEGMGYIERASDMGHIAASYALGLYFGSDKTGDFDKQVAEIQENYDAAIFYYERAAREIESAPNYPHNTYRDIPDIEGKSYMSIFVYFALSYSYYNGYIRAIRDMIKNDTTYTDTILVLTKMQNAAERCLNRPSLSVWGARQGEIAHSKQVICQARKDFADTALNLELQRVEVAGQCSVSLGECGEHKDIVSRLVQASKEMGNRIRSVPKI